jgi:hypothetical protein
MCIPAKLKYPMMLAIELFGLDVLWVKTIDLFPAK